MSQPLIKYTLTRAGRQPEWLSKDSRAFKGQHGAPANKPGKLPRFGSPQDTIYLGIGVGDPDSDGTPDGYVGTIASKADLQTYITEVGTAAGYKVITGTVTGVSTSVTTGLSTAWDADPYAGGLSTTTSTKHTASGVGTVMTLTGSQVIKVVTEVDNGSGITTSTVDTPVVLDPASTKSNVSTSVGVVTTTTSSPDPYPVGVTTTVTTTTTESYTYTDVTTYTETSKSETTTDGITTRTDTVTTTEMTNYETSYDYAAEATRLWDIHDAINA
jgi:hypothetical protein